MEWGKPGKPGKRWEQYEPASLRRERLGAGRQARRPEPTPAGAAPGMARAWHRAITTARRSEKGIESNPQAHLPLYSINPHSALLHCGIPSPENPLFPCAGWPLLKSLLMLPTLCAWEFVSYSTTPSIIFSRVSVN